MPPDAVRLQLPEPPSANVWWRYRRGQRGRKGHGQMYLSPEARAYKSAVEMLAGGAVRPIGAQRTWPVYALAVPLAIDVHWFRSRRAGDLDKRLGVLLDALQGTIYAADSQILIIHAERSEAPDGIGRVDVEITPLSPEVVA